MFPEVHKTFRKFLLIFNTSSGGGMYYYFVEKWDILSLFKKSASIYLFLQREYLAFTLNFEGLSCTLVVKGFYGKAKSTLVEKENHK